MEMFTDLRQFEYAKVENYVFFFQFSLYSFYN